MKENDNNSHFGEAAEIIEAAYKAWQNAYLFRNTRQRNKNFTYGRQLEDVVQNADGDNVTERQKLLEAGKEPLTNNLIRQLVKSVVGRYRNMAKEKKMNEDIAEIYKSNELPELDARLLEEFLISGCCVQKVAWQRRFNERKLCVTNVNPNRFFINAIADPRGWDCNIVGELHDWSIAEIIMNLANGDRNKAKWIRNIYSEDISSRICNMQLLIGADYEHSTEFWNAHGGKCRVIEVWTLEAREILRCHDFENGTLYITPMSDAARIDNENVERSSKGLTPIETQWDTVQVWHCRWLTPMGDILAHTDSLHPKGMHPYIVRLYPLTDGEIHAFVEDVIDQQKYVNRLITMVDHIMNSSAKGVLLYPADALPSGFTWDDIRRIWTTPNGIIPYESASGSYPQQVSTNATNIGAYDLLSLEMKLFDEISGVSSALQGRDANSSTGAQLYQRQTENATIALADIFDTFASFVSQRDEALLSAAKARC